LKTRALNDWLAMAVQRHPPPAVNGRRIRPKYMAQTKARPPTFVLFSSRADQLPEQYRRYLVNSLRESFDMPGVPIRMTVKSGRNPYVEGEDGKGPTRSRKPSRPGSGTVDRRAAQKAKRRAVTQASKAARQTRPPKG
jgi:GTPase